MTLADGIGNEPEQSSVDPAGFQVQPGDPARARLDTWLHAVRLFKTRSLAAQAIRASHVRVGGESVKPSVSVHPGDQVSIRRPGFTNEYIVRRALVKRVGAPVARTAYVDISPPPPPQIFGAPPRRERGTGRPTKKERREIDRLRGRDSSVHGSQWQRAFQDDAGEWGQEDSQS